MSKAAELAALIGSQTALSNRNLIINGDYKIWQRATSSTAANYSGPDRWYYGNAGTYSRSTDVPSGQGFQYSNSVKVTAATTYGVTAQRIEAVNCKHLVGKSVTASFWLKTITGATGMYCILYRANAEDDFGGGVTVIEQKTFTGVTNTWTYYTLTWENLPSETTNGLQLYFFSADASTDPEYRITGVQLEVGEQATPFEHRSYGDELLRCQRYYWQSGREQNKTISHIYAVASSTSQIEVIPSPPAGEMRAAPSLTIDGSFRADRFGNASAQDMAASYSGTSLTKDGGHFWWAVGSGTPFTYSHAGRFFPDESGGGGLQFDAEL